MCRVNPDFIFIFVFIDTFFHNHFFLNAQIHHMLFYIVNLHFQKRSCTT